jgi:hypothetical protein
MDIVKEGGHFFRNLRSQTFSLLTTGFQRRLTGFEIPTTKDPTLGTWDLNSWSPFRFVRSFFEAHSLVGCSLRRIAVAALAMDTQDTKKLAGFFTPARRSW